jgi:hypothetical protein
MNCTKMFRRLDAWPWGLALGPGLGGPGLGREASAVLDPVLGPVWSLVWGPVWGLVLGPLWGLVLGPLWGPACGPRI